MLAAAAQGKGVNKIGNICRAASTYWKGLHCWTETVMLLVCDNIATIHPAEFDGHSIEPVAWKSADS